MAINVLYIDKQTRAFMNYSNDGIVARKLHGAIVEFLKIEFSCKPTKCAKAIFR